MALNLAPFLSRQPTESGAATVMQGVEGLAQGFRDMESRRATGVAEGMAARKQTESERRNLAMEGAEERRMTDVELRTTMDGYLKFQDLLKSGNAEGAAQFAALNPDLPFHRLTPQQIAGYEAELQQRQAEDAAQAAAQAKAEADEVADIKADEVKAWQAESDARLPGLLAEAEEADTSQAAVDAITGQDFADFISQTSEGALDEDAMSRAMQSAGLGPAQMLGGLPPQQVQQAQQAQQAQQPPPPQMIEPAPVGPVPMGPGAMHPPMAAPQAAPMMAPPAQLGMGGMGIPPEMAAAGPGGTGVMAPGGVVMDPYGDRQAEEQRVMEERVQLSAGAIDSMYEGYEDLERAPVMAAKGAVENAIRMGMDPEKAFELFYKDSTRQQLERRNKRRGQEMSVRAARASAGRRDTAADDKRYTVGENMVKDQLKRFKFDEKFGALDDLERASAAFQTGNATDHMEAVYNLASAREPGGRLATADVENVPGNRGILQRLDNALKKMAGRPGQLDTKVLLESVTNSIGRLQKSMRSTHRAAKRANGAARKRGGEYGRGASAYFDTTFDDPRLDFLLEEQGTEARRRPSKSGSLRGKYGL